MTDLRAALIEAGTEALAKEPASWNPPNYGIDELAEACLDAVLDTLADRADELFELDPDTLEGERQKFVITGAIAVLRGPVSGSDSTMED